MSLQAICRHLSTTLNTTTGIAQSNDIAPEQIYESGPVVIVYPASGNYRMYTHGEPPSQMATHTIIVKVVVPAKGTEADFAKLEPLYDAVPRAILRSYVVDNFAGLITELGDGSSAPIRYDLSDEEWGGAAVRALTFTIDVMVQEDVQT